MSDVKKGYVCIHREILNHWVWNEKPMSKGQAWVDLILMANYKKQKFPYKDEVIEGQRGTIHRSITYLADRWGWGRDKASRFLRQLEKDGMIVLNATTHHTTITLINYGKYQDSPTTNRQQVGNQPTTNRQQVGTYKKDNKRNQVTKEKIIKPPALLPDTEEGIDLWGDD